MAHSSIGTRNTPHRWLLAHGMVSDKFLTIGTPSDNNNSIEKTRTAHRCLLIHTDTSRTAHNSIDARLQAHGYLLAHGWYLISC